MIKISNRELKEIDSKTLKDISKGINLWSLASNYIVPENIIRENINTFLDKDEVGTWYNVAYYQDLTLNFIIEFSDKWSKYALTILKLREIITEEIHDSLLVINKLTG